MENKNILLIAAAVAAYFVLGGKDLLSGGVSGGGGSKESKSTAITGIVPEQPGYFTPSPQPINPPAYTPTQETYQPTDKMWNDVLRVRDTPFGTSKKEAYIPQYINSTNPNMYSSYSSEEANYLTKTVGLTPADPSRGAYDVLPAGFQHADPAPVTKKESSSSSSSSSSKSQNYSSQGGGTYSNSGFGGWG